MNTMQQESRAMQAEYRTDIAHLGERIEQLRADGARRDADMIARFDGLKTSLFFAGIAVTGLVVAAIGVAITIAWPG